MKKSLTFIFAAALLVSCQQEENEATTPANSRITISPIITRATEVNFETGDKIGVTITQNGDFVYAENKQMTYSDGVFAGDLLWYPEGNDKSQIVAYYPYKEGNTPASFTVETDQTSGYGASDFMAAKKSDVISFLYEIFLSFGDVAEQKNMNFRFLPSVPSYKMFIDKGNLDKVTYNLLSNAFKYTPSNGTIILSVNVDEGKQTLQIQVSDTGVGIPKEKQNELFKRFMQSNFSGDSIGVGLHLSHELVQVHKGTIEYKDNEGGGSVFTVCIPTDKTVYSEKDFLVPGNVLLKEADGHAHHLLQLSEELPDPEKMAAPLNKRKVLIIEDDNDIREFLREEIGAYFEVEVAADGTSGFEKARTYDADLIICDVLMPGMTGFEVTKKLKTDFDTSHIPIILLTALNSPEKHLEGIEAGADAYIAKPFSVKLLLARVFRLIEQRDKLREKFSNEPGIVRPAMCTTDRDKEFADRLAAILEQNLARPEFSIDEFAQLMKLGRTVFYRKLRGVTGYSPNEYLRVVRMKKAAELLLSEDNLTVAEVSYKVGISDPFYFSKCFKAQFGVAPSVYQRGVNNEGINEKNE